MIPPKAPFSILDHLEKLIPDDGSQGPSEGSYLCPVCAAANFKIDLKTGKYNTFGCDCATTEEGKRQVRNAVSPATKPVPTETATTANRPNRRLRDKADSPIDRWLKPVRPKADRTFVYETLAEGKPVPLARVVRRDDGEGNRKFFQQHWNGTDWVKGFPEELRDRCHLYRIFDPINQEAIAQGKPLLVVEGESSVEACHELGIAATTAIGGAGKWAHYGHPNYAADLAGARLVLCPDRDNPGLVHCEEIATDFPDAQWLYAQPESPEWIELPTSGGFDVADWIEAGATAEQILGAIANPIVKQTAPAPGPTLPGVEEVGAKSAWDFKELTETDRSNLGLSTEAYATLIATIETGHDFILEIPGKWENPSVARFDGLLKNIFSLAVEHHLSITQIEALGVQCKAAGKRVGVPAAAINRELKAAISAITGREKSRYTKRFDSVKGVYGDRLRLNLLSKNLELDGTELDLDALQHDLSVTYQIDIPDQQIARILNEIGKENAYHPVVRYLDRAAETHGTDTSILNNLSARYFGTSNPLHDSYLRKTLIAAVARAKKPGCKVDTALILQGAQGHLKSTFFEVISNGWFDDTFRDVTNKDDLLKMHGAWFVEWAELENVFGKRDVSQVKAFLSTRKDPIRAPYARQSQTYQRAGIIVGSTNQDEFLSDSTGARRYWVIPVSRRIDIATLEQERDRVWAAAVVAYNAGEQWWLSAAEERESAELVAAYAVRDPWEDAISNYVEILPRVTTVELLERCLKIDLPKIGRGDEMRVAQILRQLNWRRERIRINGHKTWAWIAPDQPSPSEATTPEPLQSKGLSPLAEVEIQPVAAIAPTSEDDDWGEPEPKKSTRIWQPEPGQQVGQRQRPTRLGMLISRTERRAKVLWADTDREASEALSDLCPWEASA